MNKVFLTGRITRDPEIRYSSTGVAMLSFSLAVDRQVRDASGARQADFFNCTAFRNQAEFISRYIKKGYMLAVEGRLQTRTYQAQDGSNRYVTDIICDQVENLTPRQAQDTTRDNSQSPFPSNNNYQAPSYNPPRTDNNFGAPSYNSNDDDMQAINIDDDELPF